MFRRLWVLTRQTWRGYTRDQCGHYAAGISYYVLFSIVPLAIVAFAVFTIVLQDDALREDFTDYLLDQLPLTETEGREDIEQLIENAQNLSGTIAAISTAVALWSASAVFASIRRALNNVWDVNEFRPWFQGKLIDFGQIGVLTAILVSSMALTGFLRAVREVSAEQFGPLAAANPLWEIPPIVIPAVVTLVTFTVLYRVVPASHPSIWNVLPGAALATVLFEILKNSFAFYVANFNNYDVLYGSLAGIAIFLFFTYLSASIMLLGAELAHAIERYRAGEFHDLIHPSGPGEPLSEQALRAVRGLFVRQ